MTVIMPVRNVGVWVFVRVMRVRMPMRSTMPVSAALWLERLFDMGDLGTQPGQHVLQHMIPLDQQPVRLDLTGHVAVPDMPGEFCKAGSANFGEGFDRCPNR